MLEFIKITNDIMLKEIPYIIITNVDYREENTVMTVRVEYFDLQFNKQAFKFRYIEAQRPLYGEDPLIPEFTAYLRTYVKPVFNESKGKDNDGDVEIVYFK